MMRHQTIKVEREPSVERLEQLQVKSWPLWTCKVSTFPWHYDKTEIGYFLEGEVTVIPEGEESITLGKGDLATFPAGMSCTWKVHRPIKKHYTFKE